MNIPPWLPFATSGYWGRHTVNAFLKDNPELRNEQPAEILKTTIALIEGAKNDGTALGEAVPDLLIDRQRRDIVMTLTRCHEAL